MKMHAAISSVSDVHNIQVYIRLSSTRNMSLLLKMYEHMVRNNLTKTELTSRCWENDQHN
jgi:hypothetical protein